MENHFPRPQDPCVLGRHCPDLPFSPLHSVNWSGDTLHTGTTNHPDDVVPVRTHTNLDNSTTTETLLFTFTSVSLSGSRRLPSPEQLLTPSVPSPYPHPGPSLR